VPKPEQLLTECVLPGCREIVATIGDPCPGCLEAFGANLVPVDREPITLEQIQARDNETTAAYVAMITQEEPR